MGQICEDISSRDKHGSNIYMINAATVPQIAMMTPRTRTQPSKTPHLPASAIFADTGPITHNRKAEKEPRKAIIELNSGTRIDTPTDSAVRTTLWKTARNLRRTI